MANLIEKSCKTPGRGSKPVTYIAFDGPATVKEVMDALSGDQNKLHAILTRGYNAQARAEAIGADEFSAFVHFLAPLDESTASQFKRAARLNSKLMGISVSDAMAMLEKAHAAR